MVVIISAVISEFIHVAWHDLFIYLYFRCADLKREKLKSGEYMMVTFNKIKYIFPKEFKDDFVRLTENNKLESAAKYLK